MDVRNTIVEPVNIKHTVDSDRGTKKNSMWNYFEKCKMKADIVNCLNALCECKQFVFKSVKLLTKLTISEREIFLK